MRLYYGGGKLINYVRRGVAAIRFKIRANRSSTPNTVHRAIQLLIFCATAGRARRHTRTLSTRLVHTMLAVTKSRTLRGAIRCHSIVGILKLSRTVSLYFDSRNFVGSDVYAAVDGIGRRATRNAQTDAGSGRRGTGS